MLILRLFVITVDRGSKYKRNINNIKLTTKREGESDHTASLRNQLFHAKRVSQATAR